MSAPFVTSVRVQPSEGPHEYVSVWIRGANVGTLCVGKGDGARLARVLEQPERQSEDIDPALVERARTVTSRLHATLDAEQREAEKRMLERSLFNLPTEDEREP